MARPITAEFNSTYNNQSVTRGLNAEIALNGIARALAAVGSPVLRAANKARSVLRAYAEAHKQRREDERLWQVALTDARVMADLSRAMSREAVRSSRYY